VVESYTNVVNRTITVKNSPTLHHVGVFYFMNFSNFRFNCSDLPLLMSDATQSRPLTEIQLQTLNKLRNKKSLTAKQSELLKKFSDRENTDIRDATLSQKAKSCLKDIYVREKYDKKVINLGKDYNIGMINGTVSEHRSLELVQSMHKQKINVNKDLVYNKLIKGKLDGFIGKNIKKASTVIEIKTAQSMQSLLTSIDDQDLLNKYYWQLVGYMYLTNSQSAEIYHVVVTYDESIITETINRYLLRIRGMNIPTTLVEKEKSDIRRSLSFDDIPTKDRVIRIVARRNENDIQRVIKKLKVCKKYIRQFEKIHISMNKKAW